MSRPHSDKRAELIAAVKLWLERLEAGGGGEPPAELGDLLQNRDAGDELFFRRVAELTRRLHTAVAELRLDERLTRIAGDAIPDARHRLRHVVDLTEAAAHRTLDLVEQMRAQASEFAVTADRLIGADQADTQMLCASLRDGSAQLRERLNDLAIAQGYQDITGQIIKRVITLVEDLEGALLELLGSHPACLKTAAPAPISDGKAELPGPALPGQAAASQQDADALLASLGV